VPEQIQKRGLGRDLLGDLRQEIEGLAAVQELADAEVAAGQVFEQAIIAPAGLEAQTTDRAQHARGRQTRAPVPAKGADVTVEAGPGGAGDRCRLELTAVCLVKSVTLSGRA
jgi:hypothetical protein